LIEKEGRTFGEHGDGSSVEGTKAVTDGRGNEEGGGCFQAGGRRGGGRGGGGGGEGILNDEEVLQVEKVVYVDWRKEGGREGGRKYGVSKRIID
jgi:hypothetical protein